MNFTQVQRYEIIESIIKNGCGIEEILKISLEVLMKAEREAHNHQTQDMSNGYRYRKTYGQGKLLELKVPRTRNGNFYPVILGLLRSQEEEAKQIAFKLYGAGLTTEQVGELFNDIYGQTYSSSSISRMFDYAREEVDDWLKRPLNKYYPIIYIDAAFISTRRVDRVSKESYFTVLGVNSDCTREVLGVYNNPTEGSHFWNDIFTDIKERGVEEIDLAVTDGLSGIENVIQNHFKMCEVQLCTVHLERECLKYAKPIHKPEMANDLKEVFTSDDKNDNVQLGLIRWESFCRKWGKYYNVFKNKLNNDRYIYYFTYLKYDYRIRSMIYTTNWIERLNRDYKRTTKMRGAMPNPESVLLLLGHVAMTRKYYEYKINNFKFESRYFKWDV